MSLAIFIFILSQHVPAIICPSSGVCDCVVELPDWLIKIAVLLLLLLFSQDARSSKPQNQFDVCVTVHQVLYTTSCKHSLVLLRMGEIIARNMLSLL